MLKPLLRLLCRSIKAHLLWGLAWFIAPHSGHLGLNKLSGFPNLSELPRSYED